ncbi:gliding motility-associated C-terminal domain-containing protein [Flavobacterium sp.]|uniref:T9SS type B sorting domain-containing protein n=1 Tax=Flavobacterium sp. TaxID=239 RepID=UPI0039E537AC
MVLFLSFQSVFAQLTDFTLQVTATDESCTGNGTLTFSVGNTTPGANMLFAVYLLPNTTTPVVSTSALTVNGLSAGNYRIVATQTLGNDSNFEQQDATITTTIEELAYQLSGNINCNDGVITVNVSEGNPVQYEILSGPVTVPPQPSNVFADLPMGMYVIRVTDACGDALVQAYTLSNPNVGFDIAGVNTPDCKLVSCDLIALETTIAPIPGGSITFPINIQYTIHPPSGPNIVLSQNYPSVPDEFLVDIPFYHNLSYTVDVQVTDACGHVEVLNGSVINEHLDLILQTDVSLCDRNIKIEACNYVPPFSVSFISTPAGFNPSLFNTAHPGPYADLPIRYTSSNNNSLPVGVYMVQLTDGCGRTSVSSIEIEENVEPNYSVLPQSCGFGQVSMPGQNGSPVAQVIITSAPAAYDHPLPHNVSFNINEGHFVMPGLPAGTYVFTVVSLCLDTYEYTITIPPSGQQPVLTSYIRGCEIGFGSIRLAIQNAELTVARIMAAPAGFTQTLPYDISFNIDDEGKLYMNSLPQGIYTFYLQDNCEGQRTITIEIPGYQVTLDDISVQENCGSFNVDLNYTPNETALHTYWLQRYNTVSGHWEHPITGLSYVDGAEPDSNNALPLTNYTNNLNIASVGKFRVIRAHRYFANGDASMIFCITPIKEFDFTGRPRIIDAAILPCVSNPGQVVVVAQGLAPLHYYITSKDGAPFFVDNGNSNIFTGLTPGIYNFQVRDLCQNIVNRLFDYNSIPPPHISQSVLCDGQNGQLSVQGFDFLNYQWWNGNNPGNILSTTSQLNFSPFNTSANSGTYYVRIYSAQPGLCTDQIISYVIPVSGSNPFAGNDATTDICGSSGTVDLFSLLTGNYTTGGYWEEITSSGMQIGHSWLPVGIPYGTYRFRYTVDGLCGVSDSAEVTIHFNPLPSMPVIAAIPALACSSETIQLSVAEIPGATYVWTGPNNFSSTEQNPVVANATTAASGTYSVKASIGNCQSPTASVTVEVLELPEFTFIKGCNGNQYSIRAVPVSGAFDASDSFVWNGPNNFTSTTNPAVITEKGNYVLTVTTDEGCTATHAIDIATTACSIATGISPNGDGKNERFDLSGFDVLKFKIFSRYGNIVYEQNDYTNQWHGQDKNDRQLPDATYYYYIKLKTGEEKTGWVYVTQ